MILNDSIVLEITMYQPPSSFWSETSPVEGQTPPEMIHVVIKKYTFGAPTLLQPDMPPSVVDLF